MYEAIKRFPRVETNEYLTRDSSIFGERVNWDFLDHAKHLPFELDECVSWRSHERSI